MFSQNLKDLAIALQTVNKSIRDIADDLSSKATYSKRLFNLNAIPRLVAWAQENDPLGYHDTRTISGKDTKTRVSGAWRFVQMEDGSWQLESSPFALSNGEKVGKRVMFPGSNVKQLKEILKSMEDGSLQMETETFQAEELG